jgi:hypothetical protein
VNREGNEIIITPDNFKCFWRKINKFTSSSMSGVHYGHYKAAIQDEMSPEIFALQLTVIVQSSIPPENWSVGLQVMMEKITGVCLVENLHAIQLYDSSLASMQCKLSRKADTSRRSYSAKKVPLREKHR